ncbi:hypothetical protein GGI42DRAFT_125212 [Trichoderma sp. SZMC 28013]
MVFFSSSANFGASSFFFFSFALWGRNFASPKMWRQLATNPNTAYRDCASHSFAYTSHIEVICCLPCEGINIQHGLRKCKRGGKTTLLSELGEAMHLESFLPSNGSHIGHLLQDFCSACMRNSDGDWGLADILANISSPIQSTDCFTVG